MSVSRIFRRGFLYVTRAKKRALIFLTLYALLTFRLVFSISKVGAYYTYNLYDRRGVEGKIENVVVLDSAAYNGLLEALSDVKPYASGAYIHGSLEYRGITFVAFETLYGDPGDAPRLFPEFKPSSLVEGRYIESDDECVITQGFSVSGPITASEPRGYLEFDFGLRLEIVGVASNSTGISLVGGNAVLVTRDTLKRISRETGIEIRVFRFVVLAAGQGFPYLERYLPNLRAIATKLSSDLREAGINAEIRYNENADLSYKADVMNAIVAFFAASVVSRLYAILLTRIRRNEVAMLKTFGRRNREVAILLLSELLGETFIGFLIGVALVRKYVEFSAEISSLITAYVALMAFIAVVVIQLLGRLALMFKSIGRIRPAEIARA